MVAMEKVEKKKLNGKRVIQGSQGMFCFHTEAEKEEGEGITQMNK